MGFYFVCMCIIFLCFLKNEFENTMLDHVGVDRNVLRERKTRRHPLIELLFFIIDISILPLKLIAFFLFLQKNESFFKSLRNGFILAYGEDVIIKKEKTD